MTAVGVFDSGVGGFSVLREMRRLLPDANMLYVADQAKAPYGDRDLEDVRRLSESTTRFLVEQGASVVVLACNTASAASLHHLRRIMPETRFVGMEPAVKPAALDTTSGVIGVLATEATFQGELYASVLERFGSGVRVLTETCPGLVELIEDDAPADLLRARLREWIEPLVAAGADRLVLGCTHYPLAGEHIAAVAGPDVRVVDPSEAVARQAARVFASVGEAGAARAPSGGSLRLFTTGDPDRFTVAAGRILGLSSDAVALRRDGTGELRPRPRS